MLHSYIVSVVICNRTSSGKICSQSLGVHFIHATTVSVALTAVVLVFDVAAALLILLRALKIYLSGEKLQRKTLMGCVLQQGECHNCMFVSLMLQIRIDVLLVRK